MEDHRPDRKRHPALDYHEHPKPGKLEVRATKPLANGRDLSLAYSPGVAEASLAIRAEPADAARYTARGNLVGVISNGTAVLGLGNIGALAAKPVMEGKAVLFKKFANIDCFDIEVNEPDPVKLADLQPGDLMFFGDTAEEISHVGMYAGDGKFIHSSGSLGGVTITKIDHPKYTAIYQGARRILGSSKTLP